MPDMYLGSQLPMYQNVRVRCINTKTGKTRIERYAKNRVTRLMLWGISKFLSGEFNDSSPDKIYEYIPRYLALGANRPNLGDSTTVTTSVTVNDTRLLSEYKMLTSNGITEPVRRVSIQGRKHNKTSTQFTDSFVKLSLSAYISSTQYDGLEIGEAGLFSKEKDNNCVARVVFSPFTKQADEVIDIEWDITLLSYGTTKYPQSVTINGPSHVVIPITYTPYHIVNVDLGLRYDPDTSTLYDTAGDDIFQVLNNKIVSLKGSAAQLLDGEWDTYLKSLNNASISLELLYDEIIKCKLKNSQLYYAIGNNINKPSCYQLGSVQRSAGRENLLADSENYLLNDREDYSLASADAVADTSLSQALYMTMIYREDKEYTREFLEFTIKFNAKMDGNYNIVDKSGKNTNYKIVNNEIYVKDGKSYITTNTYIHNGYIVYDTGVSTGYVYDAEGKIYKEEISKITDVSTKAFLVWHDNTLSQLDLYQTDEYGRIQNLNYYIDWLNDKEVYNNGSDTEYHVTNDNYFAIGQTHLLKPIINPVDSTDLSVTWSISNSNIAKINQGGVVTSWNVGETYATVTTSNGIKNRVTIEVTKNTAFVSVESLEVSPSSISLNAENDKDKKITVSAKITPVFASYTTVEWQGDADLDRICTFMVQEDNTVQIQLNGSGNIGRGYITASTQDGKSASCLVTVSYSLNPDDDCPDSSHNEITS